MNALTGTTPPLNPNADAGEGTQPPHTIEDRVAQEERDKEEYKQWFSRQIELYLQDPEIIAWLDTPVRRRSPRRDLSARLIWHLEMQRADDCMVGFIESVGALVAQKPTEVVDDEELNPKPTPTSSRRRKPDNNDERRAPKQQV